MTKAEKVAYDTMQRELSRLRGAHQVLTGGVWDLLDAVQEIEICLHRDREPAPETLTEVVAAAQRYRALLEEP